MRMQLATATRKIKAQIKPTAKAKEILRQPNSTRYKEKVSLEAAPRGKLRKVTVTAL